MHVLLCLWTDPPHLLSFRRTMCDANDVIHATPVVMRGIRRRAGSRAGRILQDGPPTLCVIIGTPKGCWHAEFQSRTREASHSRRLLCQALNVQDLAERTCESSTMLGIAVMTGWHFVTSSVTNEHSRTLMLASNAFHRRRKQTKFLEHFVLASMSCSVTALASVLLENRSTTPLHVLGRRLLQDLKQYDKPAKLVKHWEETFGPLEAVVVAWPCWSPLATAISHGVCQTEVTPHFKRAEPMNMFSMPVLPSARMLSFFGSLPCVDYAEPLLGTQSSDIGRSLGSRISPVPTADIIAGLRFTRNVKSQWQGQ